ncbi:DUF1592 domain-containing protein [Blastopirellula retiformator]|uniref:PA14 domain protein n=1 Tax=Blastopirellula retiformator TaxID=2527970 RepID=A0A5C5V201_9BACT|nr:DUF1592 domain-containing protein [Blastopirellula retiformator]TWT32009.1 PA14 domain protein [Blastopirellula retiformator]
MASVGMFAVFAAAGFSLAAKPDGAAIYKKMCADCHGERGEGVSGAAENALHGTKSIEQIALAIEETMPEDDPDACAGEDAKAVAAFIHGEFYAPHARETSESRIELAHLTVDQYNNTVADLIASFRWTPSPKKERGLKTEIFTSRNFRDRAIERVDGKIDYDFGAGLPYDPKSLPEKKDEKKKDDKDKTDSNEQFSIRWQGMVLAEDTGDYEFILTTQLGAKLYVNDDRKPLIDEWTASRGEPKEHKQTIRLLGGRPYRIKLEVYKFKDDAASVKLEWKPPRKARDLLTARNLSPEFAPELFISTAPFPADDSVSGYVRGVSMSKAWDEATTAGALEVAGYVVDHLDELAKTKDTAADRRQKVRDFCDKFVERAFRRPLSEEDKKFFIHEQFNDDMALETSVKRCVLLALKSPRFLYTNLEQSPPDNYDVVSRLSYALWDTMPSEHLFRAAKENWIGRPEQIQSEAEKMLKDPRAKAKLRGFFHHWLQLDEKEGIVKDSGVFPEFSDSLASDMRTSLDLFVEDVVWSDNSDYRQLLLGDRLYVNERLAKMYEIPFEGGDSFQQVSFQPEHRAGVVTHPYMLSMLAYNEFSSPIHRGVFITRRLLGRSLAAPPQATEFKDGDFHKDMTMREKVSVLTEPAACQGCHKIINPLGFTLEHFDAIGRYRETEGKRKVDATTDFATAEGDTVKLEGARDLAKHIVESRSAHGAFVDQLFHHCVKHPINAFGPNVGDDLVTSFEKSNYNIRKLLTSIALVAALHQPNEGSAEHVASN